MRRRTYLRSTAAVGSTAVVVGCTKPQSLVNESSRTTNIRNASMEVGYEELYRNISDYKGEAVHYTGLRISDVLSNEGTKEYLFVFEEDSWGTDRVLYGVWKSDPFREDDDVKIWGVIKGMETFESWTGDKTVPKVAVKKMELR